jgi:hypothetical protein
VQQVNEVERLVLVNTSGAGGGIRLAQDEGMAPPSREIIEQVIYNGTTKEVRYFAPTLSAAEKQELATLERTINELNADEAAVTALARGPEPAREPRPEPAGAAPAYAWSSYHAANIPGGVFNPLLVPIIANPPTPPASASVNVTMPAEPKPAATSTPSLAEQQQALQEARARLERSRQTYLSAQRRTVVDAEGAIVAVRLESEGRIGGGGGR